MHDAAGRNTSSSARAANPMMSPDMMRNAADMMRSNPEWAKQVHWWGGKEKEVSKLYDVLWYGFSRQWAVWTERILGKVCALPFPVADINLPESDTPFATWRPFWRHIILPRHQSKHYPTSSSIPTLSYLVINPNIILFLVINPNSTSIWLFLSSYAPV